MIRRATTDDTEPLRALYDEFHAFHVRGMPDYLRMPAPGEADPAEFARAVERLAEDEEATLLAAESDDGRLIGFAEVYLDPLHESPFVVRRRTATLQSLFVTETCRRTGLGRALARAAEQWAADHGAEEIKTKTWQFPEGPLAFYESLGYKILRHELAHALPRRAQ